MVAVENQKPVRSRMPARHSAGLWRWAAFFIAFLVLLPVFAILAMASNPAENIWPHLIETMLPRYVSNTLLLMLGVGGATLFGGVCTAWLVTMCRFPGRRIFEWALLLPMAVPAYVIAYVYTDLLDYAGPVQIWLRELFGWRLKSAYFFPEIRSHGGAILMLSLVLYPYVYMLTRVAFIQQSVCVLEAGRVLGLGPWACFFRVAIPLARPALVVGVSLVLMETLNDFGTIDFFGVHTLTAGVFDIWMIQGNLGAAAQVAMVMLLFVAGLLWIERVSRKGQKYHASGSCYQALPGFHLRGFFAIAAWLVCLAPVLLGFLLPAALLADYAFDHWRESLSGSYLTYARNSLLLSGSAAIVTVLTGIALSYAIRLGGGRGLLVATRLATVGYAMPGAVLAIGVLVPFAWVDNQIDTLLRGLFGVSSGLILSGTVIAVIFAYVVRFLAVAQGGVEAGLLKVTPTMDDAARSLGATPGKTLRLIHLPMIRSGLLGGGILVFVDAMKELPATLVLRPFNFDTLATYVYQYASDELLEQCAFGALTIVAAGIIPVIILSQAIRRSRPGAP